MGEPGVGTVVVLVGQNRTARPIDGDEMEEPWPFPG
jgi:hypothetical protein